MALPPFKVYPVPEVEEQEKKAGKAKPPSGIRRWRKVDLEDRARRGLRRKVSTPARPADCRSLPERRRAGVKQAPPCATESPSLTLAGTSKGKIMLLCSVDAKRGSPRWKPVRSPIKICQRDIKTKKPPTPPWQFNWRDGVPRGRQRWSGAYLQQEVGPVAGSTRKTRNDTLAVSRNALLHWH